MCDLKTLPSLASLSKEEKRKLLRGYGTSIFYAYAYLRPNGTPYYVGKGSKRRCMDPHDYVKVPPEDRIVFLGLNLTEMEALSMEMDAISDYGRKQGGGILVNFTDGGQGVSGYKFDPEVVRERNKKISESNKGRTWSEEDKRRIAESVSGFKWYTNGKESIQSFEHPGEGWTEGRLRTWKPSATSKGMKWYSRYGESKLFAENPGDGWVLGRKSGTPRGHRTNTGKKWYNNGSINQMFEVPPDDSWMPGMMKRSHG